MKTNEEVIKEYIEANRKWLSSFDTSSRIARIICDATRHNPEDMSRGSRVEYDFEFLYEQIAKALKDVHNDALEKAANAVDASVIDLGNGVLECTKDPRQLSKTIRNLKEKV